jgi:AraC family transcriptional regulator, regulatory protein of adaptative response / methylated-DNA-[protein]-cysteine methyltransferase
MTAPALVRRKLNTRAISGVESGGTTLSMTRPTSNTVAPMTESSVRSNPHRSSDGVHDITYCYGQSSLGDFLAAVDDTGLCAVLFDGDHANLLHELRSAFPNKKLVACDSATCCAFIVNAVARLMDQPATSGALPTSISGGDFRQMVYAALRHTRPGTTITPEAVALMIGASIESAPHVRACAATDVLAVAVPFHRLQEHDGTNPAYRWGEERRQMLLERESRIRAT